MPENDDNLLRTRLEIEAAQYKTDLQSQYVQPSEEAAQKVGQALDKSTEKLVNAGKASLARLAALGQGAATAKPTFAEDYKRAFDDVTQRAEKTRKAFADIARTKLASGNFDVIGQGAVVAEKRVADLVARIAILKRAASTTSKSSLLESFTKDIQSLEKELAKFEQQQRTSSRGGGAGGGGTPGGGGGFGNLGGGQVAQLAGAIPGVGNLAAGFAVGGGIGLGVAAILETKKAASELLSLGVDLGKQAVELAGDFEQTTNALAVFAGSTNAAKAELSDIDAVARETAGLRLQSAEEGYQRLRALGFQADLTSKLIKGIGIQRVNSGVDEAAVGRVITNLQQIQATPENAGRDIKEIIKAIPSLTGVFKEGFGTADYNKLSQILKANPDEFFKKFGDAIANSKQAQAGLNISLEKGKDAVIELGRAFGEPFLDVFTKDVKGLTGFLNDNQTAIHEWGQTFADVLSGVSTYIGLFAKAHGKDGSVNVLGVALRATAAIGTVGLSEVGLGLFESARSRGEEDRKKAQAEVDRARHAQYLASGSVIPDQNVSRDAQGNLTFSDKTPEEQKKAADSAAVKVAEAQETLTRAEQKAQDERQKLIERRRDTDVADIQSRLEYAKALENSLTGKVNPVEIIRVNARLEEQALRAQIAVRNNAAADALRNLSSADFNDGKKGLEISQANAADTGKLQDQISLVRLNARKAETDEIKRQAEAVHALRNEVRDFLVSATDAARDNNPFLKIFSDAASVVDRFEQRFKQFGVTFAREMAKIELARLQGDAAQIRYGSSAKSLGYAQQARRLELEPESQRGEFQFRLSRVQAKADYAAQQSDRARQSKYADYYAYQYNPNNPVDPDTYFRGGFNQAGKVNRADFGAGRNVFSGLGVAPDVTKFFAETANALEDIQKIKAVSTQGTGIYGQGAIAEQILKEIPDALLPSLVQKAGGFGQEAENARNLLKERATALQQTKVLGEQKFKDFVANQEFVTLGRADAEERLKNLKDARGLTDRQRNQEFLNITGEIGSENLTPALRKARVEALNEASRLEKQNEKDALDALKAVAGTMEKIDKIIGDKGLKMQLSDVPILNLNVANGLSVDGGKQPPATPTARDTARNMGLEVQRIDNGF